MVNLGLKTPTSQTGSEESGVYTHWSDVETTWIEGKAGCPHCGKSLKIACEKDMDVLHIAKDEDTD